MASVEGNKALDARQEQPRSQRTATTVTQRQATQGRETKKRNKEDRTNREINGRNGKKTDINLQENNNKVWSLRLIYDSHSATLVRSLQGTSRTGEYS